jgi:autotransporter-associated beta strand protein
LILTNTNTYSSETLVSAGTLLVNGSLSNSAVTVNAGAFGGNGTVGSTLDLLDGSFHVVDLSDAPQVSGTVTLYAGFGIDDLAGLSWESVADVKIALLIGRSISASSES